MTPEEIQKVLAERFGETVGALQPAKQDPWVLVKGEAIAEVCRFLKDDPRTRMDCLMNLTAIDWPKRNQIDVVYHLFSYPLRHVFVLKTQLDRARRQYRASSRSGRRPTGSSESSSTSSACSSRGTRISAVSCCRTTGSGTRCARTTRKARTITTSRRRGRARSTDSSAWTR